MTSAEALYSAGNLPQALECYRDIVTGRLTQIAAHESNWWAADVIVLERLADLAILEGSLAAAQDLLTGLRELYLREDNRYAADYVAIKLSHLALENNNVSEAHTWLQALTDIIGDLDSIDLSENGLCKWETTISWPGQDEDSKNALLVRLYIVMGGLLSAYGQFQDAMHCLARGEMLSCTHRLPSISQTCAPLRIALAYACLATGSFPATRAWLDKAENVQSSLTLQVRIDELRGKLALMTGHYGEALKVFDRVLTRSSQLGFSRPMAIASLNIANLLILLNQTQNALEHIENAIAFAEDDPVLLTRAKVLRSLSYSRRESLADQVAITPSVSEIYKNSAHEKSIPDSTQIPTVDPLELPASVDFLTFFEDRALALQWRLNQERVDEAAQLMTLIQKTFLSSDSPLIHCRIGYLQGMLEYYLGNISAAAEKLTGVIAEQQRLKLAPEAWQSKRILSWCLSRLDKSDEEIAHIDNEVQTDLEKLKASLQEVDQQLFMLNKWTSTEEYFLGEINILVSLERRALMQAWWHRPFTRYTIIKRINRLLGKLEEHKFNNITRFLNMKRKNNRLTGRILPLWRRLLFHPLRTATIHFLVLPDRVLIIQHSWLRLGFGVSAISRADLRDLVAAWYRSINTTGCTRDLDLNEGMQEEHEQPEQEREHNLKRLAEALQLNVLLNALPARIKSLRIAPDDSLLGFPFAVLQYRGALLPKHFSLSILLPQLANSIQPHQSIKDVLLVGVSKGNEHVTPLPEVQRELDNMQTWVQQHGYTVRQLSDEAAEKTAVMRALEQTNLLHIACHGVFQADKPGETGFVLLPGDKPQILSLAELSQLNLNQLKHASLSSCWLADRFVLPGRQTIGLPETLLHCGAGSVLACLWPVNDLLAIHFMAQFYKNLEYYPRDEALRRTQEACIKNTLPNMSQDIIDTSSLVHWAGFTLYGSIEKL